jgi:hypothetical protein
MQSLVMPKFLNNFFQTLNKKMKRTFILKWQLVFHYVLHVSSVAQNLSGLRSSLVASGLKSDVCVSQTADLFFGEVPTVLGRHLRTHARPLVFGMKLRLKYFRILV